MCTTTRAAFVRHLAIPVAVCIATVGASCSGDQAFPDRVPVRGHYEWVDPPLERAIEQERAEIADTLVGFLRQHRAESCQFDDVSARRLARQQAKARIMYSHSRAELQGEQVAMRASSASAEDNSAESSSANNQSKEIDLTPIVPFDKASDRPKATDTNLLPWQCELPVEQACLEPLGQHTVDAIYGLHFGGSRISRSATAQVLPVLRRDLEWGLSQIGDDAGREQVVARIEELCLAGKSPLGNFLIEHADTDDDRLSSLVRSLGGSQPCDTIAGMYDLLLRSLATLIKAPKSQQICVRNDVGGGITARLSARSSRPSLTEMEPRRYSRAKAVTDSKSYRDGHT